MSKHHQLYLASLRRERSSLVGRLCQARKATDSLAPCRIGNLGRERQALNLKIKGRTNA